jgi:hypothetical protein
MPAIGGTWAVVDKGLAGSYGYVIFANTDLKGLQNIYKIIR